MPSARLLLVLLCSLLSVNAIAEASSGVMQALRSGDHHHLERLLRRGANANQRLADGSLPLSWAVDQQDLRGVRLLLKHGAWVNDPDDSGNAFRPLFIACLHPEPAILAALLDRKANVQVRGPDGIPALSPCAARAPADVVRRLLASGAEPNAIDNNGQTPLMWAALYGRLDNFDLLLSAGADLHHRSKGGFTPTQFAVKSGNADIARRALAAGADPQQVAIDGTTLVQLAMYQSNFGFAQTLIDLGVDVDAYDRNGRQLLHAAVLARQPQLVAQLLAAGADLNADTGESAVQWRFESNFKAGSYEFPRSSPLLLAAQAGDAAIMGQLIEAGADVSAVTSEGNNLALAAASSGVPAVLKLALTELDSTNAQNSQGETPLHRVLASARGDALSEMLALLAAHGARSDLPNQAGKTPAQIATDPHFKGRDAFAAAFAAQATESNN